MHIVLVFSCLLIVLCLSFLVYRLCLSTLVYRRSFVSAYRLSFVSIYQLRLSSLLFYSSSVSLASTDHLCLFSPPRESPSFSRIPRILPAPFLPRRTAYLRNPSGNRPGRSSFAFHGAPRMTLRAYETILMFESRPRCPPPPTSSYAPRPPTADTPDLPPQMPPIS